MLIEALRDTTFKREPVADPTRLDESQKFILRKDEQLTIVSFSEDTESNHYIIKLQEPIKGFFHWFAYKPDVQII